MLLITLICFRVIALGGGIALIGFFLASFATTVCTFAIFYGSMGGIGCGINYFIPIVCAWEYFPHKKGLCTGILVGACGIGQFIFTQISTRIMNPLDLNASILITEDLSFFSAEVANNVPRMLRILALVQLLQISLGVMLIS